MRSQIYQYLATADSTSQASIFVGGLGNNITKPAETTATQFVVIEQVASTPSTPITLMSTSLGVYSQIRINTTDYFQNPDVTQMNGVPGLASPYPRGSPSGFTQAGAATTYNPDNLLKSFDLYPDVYVLPGQVFQILYTTVQGAPTQVVQCFVKYTLYDGPDALIANKLLELGVTINPNNVDWYKRSLIEQQTRSAVAATAAAAGGQA